MKRFRFVILILLIFHSLSWAATFRPESYLLVEDKGDYLGALWRINEAIPSSGGTILFESGETYYISDGFGFTKSNITVMAYGATIFCDRDSWGGGTIGFMGLSRDQPIRNCKWFGGTIKNIQSNEDEVALWTIWADGVVFRDVTVDGSERKGFSAHYSKDVWLINCTFRDTGFAGIDFYNDMLNGSMAYGKGLHAIGNTIERVHAKPITGGGYGILASVGKPGIEWQENIEVTGNVIRDTDTTPILIQNVRYPTIQGNVISAPQAITGIYTYGCLSEDISRNRILEIYSNGFSINAPGGFYRLESNWIERFIATSGRIGIWIYGAQKQGQISGNIIPENTEIPMSK